MICKMLYDVDVAYKDNIHVDTYQDFTTYKMALKKAREEFIKHEPMILFVRICFSPRMSSPEYYESLEEIDNMMFFLSIRESCVHSE